MAYKIKICGMKHPDNIHQLAMLKPDFIGFIFYEKSKRFIDNRLNIRELDIDKSIAKTGVFVNASEDYILKNIEKHDLNLIQLHGDESPDFCGKLHQKGIKISKAFQIDDDFDFLSLNLYKKVCDYFLFDTKTKNYGGSGRKFDWQVLEKYDNEKPFFLSGGIDLEDVDALNRISGLNIFAIDINSKFEIEAGLKDIGKIGMFMELLNLAQINS
ncbi:MAG: phosphoribosylanthranilate isomerase [Bacteroidales bacterium]|nr:phosphoribosylanthranilate isomerase [Bacteroidales bacterium]